MSIAYMERERPIKKPKATRAPFLRTEETPPTNLDAQPPAFSFEKMADGSGHSFNCCQEEDRLALSKRMFMLSRMPWQQINLAPSKGMGAEKISRGEINPGIPTAVTEDVSYFYSLHYYGKKRFIGYKVGQIFHILWVDHNFGVYDHGP